MYREWEPEFDGGLTSVSELDRGKSITNLNGGVSDCNLWTRGFLRAKKGKAAANTKKKIQSD